MPTTECEIAVENQSATAEKNSTVAGGGACDFIAVDRSERLPEDYTGSPEDIVKRHIYEPPVTAFDQQQYDDAIALWREFGNAHAFSLTALLDVPRLIGELEERRNTADGFSAPGSTDQPR